MITVKIENDYSDGHHSERAVVLPEPSADRLIPAGCDEWFESVVFPETGDGHGTDGTLGSCYTATITHAADAKLVGKSYEWID